MVKREIQQNESIKREKNKGSVIILNEWEKLAALSNRRLTLRNSHFFIKMSWSIDRLTIVGELQTIRVHERNFSGKMDVVEYTFDQVMATFEEKGFAEKVGEGWKLKDKYGENVAYFEKVKFAENKGRMDFNPNKIGRFIGEDLKHFIHRVFVSPHFSRADIACDIVGAPNDLMRNHELIEVLSKKLFYGLNGKIETKYWGSRSSEKQVRLYNKLKEQRDKKKVVPLDIKSWWRFELQLRQGKAEIWTDIVAKTLASFCSPEYIPDSIKGSTKIMLVGLLSDTSLFSELGSHSKAKYRKLLREVAEVDEVTQHMLASFSEQYSDLKNELDSWLNGLDVDY